jgi:hypothetical protein
VALVIEGAREEVDGLYLEASLLGVWRCAVLRRRLIRERLLFAGSSNSAGVGPSLGNTIDAGVR